MAEQRSTLIIEISSEQAARNARALDRELQSIERTGNYATTSMNSMSVAARQLAGVVTVGTAIAKMDTYTGLQNRLKLVTKSQTELNTAMTDTFAIAQKTASSWDSTAMVYQRFADNADRLTYLKRQFNEAVYFNIIHISIRLHSPHNQHKCECGYLRKSPLSEG